MQDAACQDQEDGINGMSGCKGLFTEIHLLRTR